MPSLSMILRLALLSLSFGGLCGTLRHSLKLHRLIAPCFTACLVICVLMAAGMLRALGAGLLLLHTAGIVGFVYTFLIRKVKPDFFLIGLLALLIACLTVRFSQTRLTLTDDFSHWALIARHMLETDALPDAGSTLITFRSYPPASACFIYYICRGLISNEGMWLIAQNLLMVLMLLPIFAVPEGKCRWLAPAFPVLLLLLFKFDRPFSTLVVDWLLSAFGAGMAAIAVSERRNPRRALLITLPCMLVCVWLKSSGIFFSLCTAALIGCFAYRTSGRRRSGWIIVAAAVAACACAFLLWNLHVKAAFPDGADTKHAVSLSAYSSQASGKGLMTILKIGAKMAFEWLRPAKYQILTLLFTGLCFAAVLIARKKRPARRALCSAALKALAACVAVYAVWYAMIFAMYVFSMPEDEAIRLAALERYDSTGLHYMIGLMCIVMLRFLSRFECFFRRIGRKAVLLSIVLAVSGLALAPMADMEMHGENLPGFYQDLTTAHSALDSHRAAPIALLENHDIPRENGRFIICLSPSDSQSPVTLAGYTSKYELHSADIAVLMRLTAPKYEDAPYLLRSVHERHYLEDPIPALAKGIDQCDAILVYGEDPVFQPLLDEFLDGYAGDTPVYYADR